MSDFDDYQGGLMGGGGGGLMPQGPSMGGGLLDGFNKWMQDPRNQQTLMAFGANLMSSRNANAGTALTAAMSARNDYDQKQQQKTMYDLQLQKLKQDLNQKVDPRSYLGKVDIDKHSPASIQAFLAGNGDFAKLQQNPANVKRDVREVNGQLIDIPPQGAPMPIFGQPKLPDVLTYGPDGKPMVNPLIVQAKSQIAAAGKPQTTVSVNTGQKGLDNDLKVRSDFRSEPIYKAHQEVQSAHQQIKQGLTLASPAGDLAAATKIMKLLDPTSVVRESELAMAMAAGGKFDRLAYYAQNTLSGNKLTPTQRIDFRKLADGLFQESESLYNAKRGEYKDIAKQYELNADLITGKDAGKASAASDPLGLR